MGIPRHKLAPAVRRQLPPAPKRMNRRETEAYWILKDRFPGAIIIPQFRIRVSAWDDVRPVHYTADFALWYKGAYVPEDAWICCLYEVKDRRRRYHSNELKSPKLVKSQNPWIDAVYLLEFGGTEYIVKQLA